MQFDCVSVSGDRQNKSQSEMRTFAEPAVESMRQEGSEFSVGFALPQVDANPSSHVHLINTDAWLFHETA
jgi:hypothetical protein